jgi:hypothetical protein
MKAILTVLAFIVFPLSADTITWRTYTGWDHGYTLTVDDQAATITLVEHFAGKKDAAPKVQKFRGSIAFTKYVGALLERIPKSEVGPESDDGRVIEVKAVSGNKTTKRKINEIVLSLYPAVMGLGSTDDPNGKKLATDKVKKATLFEAGMLRELAEAYILQEMMFDLKKRYFEKEKDE